MGCGSSHDAYMRDRRAYHGVAMAPVVSHVPPVSCDFVACAAGLDLHTREAQVGTNKKVSDDFYFGVSRALHRRMQRQRSAEWRKAILGIVQEKQQGLVRKPRYDYLTKFGAFQLCMVDELSLFTQVGMEATKTATMSHGVTRSGNHSFPSFLSTSGCTTFVNQASIRLDTGPLRSVPRPCIEGTLLSISSGLQNSSCAHAVSMWTNASASVNSNAFSSSFPFLSPRRQQLPLRGYAVRPCNSGHAYRVNVVLLVPQGDIVLSCSTVERHLTAYHLHLMEVVGRLFGHDDVILGGAVRPDGRLVATASRDCSVILWELLSCKQRRSLPHPAAVHACRFSSTGGELATVCADGLCRVWTWSDTDVVHTPVSLRTGFDGPLTSFAYSRGDRQLVAGGAGNTIFVWDRQHFHEAAATVFRQHRSTVFLVDASHTMAGVVVSGDKSSVYLWNCETLAVLHHIGVDSWCLPRRRGPRAKVLASVEVAPVASSALYWTAVRLVDTCFGAYVVAAASDKCAHLFHIKDSRSNTQMQGNNNDTASTTVETSVSEVLSLPLSSSLSSVDGGPLNLIALGDACGNRHVLTLL